MEARPEMTTVGTAPERPMTARSCALGSLRLYAEPPRITALRCGFSCNSCAAAGSGRIVTWHTPVSAPMPRLSFRDSLCASLIAFWLLGLLRILVLASARRARAMRLRRGWCHLSVSAQWPNSTGVLSIEIASALVRLTLTSKAVTVVISYTARPWYSGSYKLRYTAALVQRLLQVTPRPWYGSQDTTQERVYIPRSTVPSDRRAPTRPRSFRI